MGDARQRGHAGDVLGQQGNRTSSPLLRISISLPNEYLALGNALNDQVPNPFFGVIAAGPLSEPHHFAPAVPAALPAVLRR